MASSDGFEGGLDVGEGLDAIDLCGFDQGSDAAPGVPTLVMSCEQRIFPVMQRSP